MTPAQVEDFLNHLNKSWLDQDYEALASAYHPEVILLPPDAGIPLEGRETICATYQDFHAACSVDRFMITELQSWTFAQQNQTVTKAHMRFEIDYRLKDVSTSVTGAPPVSRPELQCEQGLEVYTLLSNPGSAPQIIWRAQFTL